MKKTECFKEFKVRMDRVKCEKYKTVQPELPTKKFMFSDERESIHNMKLLHEDSSDQNKATTVHCERENVEETVVKQQPVKEEKVFKAMTGMFRDNKRRIDLVLVVENDVNELVNKITMDFLTYIVRAELEVEIEPGLMKNHQKLTFIKIHAPDCVLERYGKFFGTKRYFADSRYDYMDLKEKKLKNYDKEWVMFVRNNYETPNGYSNYERSIIVYKMLLHLSFGDNANYYGIERLLNKKVILDVFALHDGPYFITPDQTISGSNPRQILYYHWCRIQNIFQQQPIHLIHEYFGPRISFYFAFHEFFTKALKVFAFIGIFNIILGLLNLTILEKAVKKSICTSSLQICKFCENEKICPKRVCSDYCLSIQIHLILDHLLIPLYSIITLLWAFIFLRLWQRREYFLKWIWEVGRRDSYYKNAVRPLFDTGVGMRTDPFIGGLKYSESIIPIFLRNVISKLIIILFWYAIVPLMYMTFSLYEKFCKDMKTNDYYKKYRDYIVMSMFQSFHTLLITGCEKIYHHIVYFLVKFENHNSYKKFNESVVIKKIAFKMVFQYAFIAYYAWLHGKHYRYKRCNIPLTKHTPYAMFKYLAYTVYGYKDIDICDKHRFCFPYSCIIEVATLLATVLVVTQVVYKVTDYIFSLKTDYNQSKYSSSDIPCWEREYRLISVTEEDMIQRYIYLAAQFILVTWFVIAFPLGPLILYLINIWDIRHKARKLLLASRRPLLIKTPGTEMIKVFYFIAFIAVLTNAINIATVTRSVLRYIMAKQSKKPDDLFTFGNFNYRDYKCYAPDLIGKYYLKHNQINFYFYDLPRSVWYRVDYYMVSIYGCYYFYLFVFAMVCVFLIAQFTIPRQREVELAKAREEKVRKLYYHYEYEYKDSKDK